MDPVQYMSIEAAIHQLEVDMKTLTEMPLVRGAKRMGLEALRMLQFLSQPGVKLIPEDDVDNKQWRCMALRAGEVYSGGWQPTALEALQSTHRLVEREKEREQA